MAKSRENGSSYMFIICMVFWLIGRIVSSTLMIVPLPYLGSNFIECSNFSTGFDQLATRLSDAMLFVIIVVIFALLAIAIPYKWIRSTIFGVYVLALLALLGYHVLMNLATVIQLLIERHNGHFVDPKVECTSGMSFFGSLIAFLFHTFVALNILAMFQSFDNYVMNLLTEKESQVAKVEQKAAKDYKEMV